MKFVRKKKRQKTIEVKLCILLQKAIDRNANEVQKKKDS